MKLYSQVSVFGAVLALATAFASADTIQLGSYQTGGPTLGNGNTAVAYVGSTTTTYALNPGAAWAAPGANSTWVSNNPNSAPGGSVNEAAGIYSYTTTFTTLAGSTYAGAIWVLADDTASILLNGNAIPVVNLLGLDTHCSDSGIGCLTPTLINLPSAYFVDGINTLRFDLQQTILSTGLDFYGTIIGTAGPVGGPTAVPEPGTLFLLGTGLIGSAGFLMRRSRSFGLK
jgi:hypothetical protein